MNDYVKVQDHAGLVRDKSSGAILNVDHNEIQQARARKAQRQKENEELDKIKKDVDDIKSLLNQIIGKLDGPNSKQL